MAELILSSAVILLLMVSLLLVLRWCNAILYGEMPTRFFAFFAILFTSGLDVGLIIFPLGSFRFMQQKRCMPSPIRSPSNSASGAFSSGCFTS